MQLIALTGAKGAGKDTVADHLVRHHGFVRLAFADPLRDEIAAAFGVPLSMLTTPGRKEEPNALLALGRCPEPAFVDYLMLSGDIPAPAQVAPLSTQPWSAQPRSARWIMQRWGDWRRWQDAHYFVDRLQDRIDTLPGRRIVITDVHLNPVPHQLIEVHFVKRQGLLWQVRRAGTGGLDQHATEWPVPIQYIDQVLHNDSTIPVLHRLADQLLSEQRWPLSETAA
ncbi:hypothetical protein N8I74_10900 [Chitiniphilus purpureus]|uniref:Deoxynucleotide monophosphate kinase n=1 Tax=Chitiniphilus purpureus TaxID=2981137 RepID=A0ABY6DHK6_9NEIS|nr:hypothetical protein [Chitiniphilus sp. CD1]UXY13830.1 hypothetical protein N8I74_10900 [Chitiniphilus sp. CD1]